MTEFRLILTCDHVTFPGSCPDSSNDPSVRASILALKSITLNAGGSVGGRVFALNGSVAMANNLAVPDGAGQHAVARLRTGDYVCLQTAILFLGFTALSAAIPSMLFVLLFHL